MSFLDNIFPKNTGSPAGGSAIEQIMAGLTRPRTTGESVADVGSTLGALSQGEKANRISEGDLRQNYDAMMLRNQQANNQLGLDAQGQRDKSETDALKKLQQTSYIMGGGANFAPPTYNLSGKSVTAPTFSGVAPMGKTPDDIAGASSLHSQMLDRLKDASFHPDLSYHPTPVDEYAKPGTLENIGSYGGAATSLLGNLMDMPGVGNKITDFLHMGGTGALGTAGTAGAVGGAASGLGALGAAGGLGTLAGAPVISSLLGNVGGIAGATAGNTAGLMSAVPQGIASQGISSASGAGGLMSGLMGKALPITGAVTGAIGLMKNRGLGANVMNGATTGASIGSMVPGLGTLVGGAIGAGVGALRGIGGPSQNELHGRDAQTGVIDQLTSGATPQQIQEAHNSGWEKPNDALGLIVVRDKLAQKGLDPMQANQLMDQLFKAEKSGPQAVQTVASQIQRLMA